MRDDNGRLHNPAGLPRGVAGAYAREHADAGDMDLAPVPLPREPVPYGELARMLSGLPGVNAVVGSGLDDRPMVVARTRRGDVYVRWRDDGNLAVDDDVLDMRMIPDRAAFDRVLAGRFARYR